MDRIPMVDKYRSFSELAENEVQDRDFRVRFREVAGTAAIIAPHGGEIERGTSEIADAIAADDLSFYAFEGMKSRCSRLHITSHRFDEPSCMALLQFSPRAITVHGQISQSRVVFLGGLDGKMLERLRALLERRGFCVRLNSRAVQGRHPANICNRTRSGVGVQLELTRGLRRSFFESLSKNGRRRKTEHFQEFVAAVRDAVLNCPTEAVAQQDRAEVS